MPKGQYSFSKRLRALREQHRLSKSALARAIGVTTTCVWNWEQGNTEPRAENLSALSRALNVPTAYLLSGGDVGEGLTDEDIRAGEGAGLTLSEVIADAKLRIAALAGIPPAKVKISLDY